MGFFKRGIANCGRNKVRTFSIIAILALATGMSLTMVLSLQAVDQRTQEIKASIGNTITVSPAGVRGFEGGGEPLSQSQFDQISQLDNVVAVQASLSDRLTTDQDTNLQSAVDAGSIGRRFANGGGGPQFRQRTDSQSSTDQPAIPTNITIPITVSASTTLDSNLNITQGQAFAADTTDHVAIIGQSLAEKNSLSVGSTFTAFETQITVVAISNVENTFANNNIVMPLTTLQQLSDQADQYNSFTVQTTSIDTLDSVTQAIKDKLGTEVDVISTADTSEQALAPLTGIRQIATYGLYGSLLTGAVIIFLTMTMIARERRKEIGVLKAIGAPNLSIIGQYVTEAITLTFVAGVIGLTLSVLLSNPMLQALVNTSSSTTTSATATMPGGLNPGAISGQFRQITGPGFERLSQNINPQAALDTLQTSLGWPIILIGLGVILLIAILGSAIPAYLTTRVKPAEVIRSE